jgi:hypothetical protein
MDAEMETLAASAATALVGLMVSDLWTQAKETFGRLFARRNSRTAASDLDTARAELVAARESGQSLVVSDIEAEWRARFRRLLRQDGTVGDEIRELLRVLVPGPESDSVGNVHNVVSGGVQHGPVIQSGRISGLIFSNPAPDLSAEG